MTSFIHGFSAELCKLAANDTTGEPATQVFNDPLEATRSAVESTSGRNKNLVGRMPSALQSQTKKTIPAPETTPSSMQGFTT